MPLSQFLSSSRPRRRHPRCFLPALFLALLPFLFLFLFLFLSLALALAPSLPRSPSLSHPPARPYISPPSPSPAGTMESTGGTGRAGWRTMARSSPSRREPSRVRPEVHLPAGRERE